MKISLFMCLVCLTCICSHAQDSDGNQLLEQCNIAINVVDAPNQVTPKQAEGLYCVGLVRGIVDTVVFWQASDIVAKNREPRMRPCIPESGIATIQGVRVVVKYLKDHPEMLHNDASFLVLTALKNAFPCKQLNNSDEKRN
jgi:hypothetical protein